MHAAASRQDPACTAGQAVAVTTPRSPRRQFFGLPRRYSPLSKITAVRMELRAMKMPHVSAELEVNFAQVVVRRLLGRHSSFEICFKKAVFLYVSDGNDRRNLWKCHFFGN